MTENKENASKLLRQNQVRHSFTCLMKEKENKNSREWIVADKRELSVINRVYKGDELVSMLYSAVFYTYMYLILFI